MNKMYKFAALLSVCLMAIAGCTREEFDTDQYSDEAVTFAGFAPNPVARGGALRITGSNLQKVTEVIIPGIDPITDIEVVAEGKQSEIRVIVPVDGPEIGTIAIVAEGKTYESLAELTYSEPIIFTDFSPKSAMAGDEITIKGDYMNNIRTITFEGGTEIKEFVSQSRYEMKFVVPASAVTGKFILGDVDPDNNPDNLIANLFYSAEELVIGEPTVKEAERGVLKSGAEVTVSGEYLDMIQSVNFGGADAEFTVAEDGKSLVAVLPATAVDGDLVLVSYAGAEHKAGAYQTLVPSELKIAAESRYKAGLNAFITGKDLDLVTGVSVSGVAASFAVTAENITVTVPAESPDGDVVVSLENGKTVTVGAVEVVKPVIESLSAASVVAGQTFDILGKDLDLVTTVSVGEIEADSLEVAADKIVVHTSRLSKTGDIVAVAANGDQAVSSIEVTYDESIAITDMPSTLEVKSRFVFKGTGFAQIEAIYIDGAKVLAYTTRTDTEFGFILPDDVTPGVYTMDIVLISGETLTWAIPFEVTGSYKLTTVWEAPDGQIDLTWGDPRPTVPVAAFEDLPKGSSMIFCFTQKDQTWGQIQINNGQWQGLVFPEVGSNTLVPTDKYGWEFAYREFEVQLTDDIIATIKANAGDFNGVQTGLILQGDGMYFNKIVIKSPSEAPETVLWEGELIADDWGNQPYALSDAGLELQEAGAQAGQTVYFYIETLEADWKLEVVEGHWGPTYCSICAVGSDTEGGKFTEYDLAANNGRFGLVLTQEMLDAAFTQQWWGGTFVLNGDNVKVTKITLQ